MLLERRQNVRALQDKKYTLYERAVTYEGAEHYSRATPVKGSILPSIVQGLCKSIVSHVAEVSFQKFNINRMALNVKVDPDDRVWVLWCTSLRLDSRMHRNGITMTRASGKTAANRGSKGPVHVDIGCSVPKSVQATFTTTRPSSSKPTALRECQSCGKAVLSDRFHKVKYKTVVRHFEELMSILAADSGGTKIEWPPDKETIALFGGVGLGPLKKAAKKQHRRPRRKRERRPLLSRKTWKFLLCCERSIQSLK